MASSVQGLRLRNGSHRTNSLAFAKSPCHTCSTLNEQCDLQRPQCGTCISHRRKCGGFAMDLVWKDPSRSGCTDSPSCSGNARLDSRKVGASSNQAKFKFVQGRPKRKRKPNPSRRNMAQMTATFDLQPPTAEPLDPLLSLELTSDEVTETYTNGLDARQAYLTASIPTFLFEFGVSDCMQIALATVGAASASRRFDFADSMSASPEASLMSSPRDECDTVELAVSDHVDRFIGDNLNFGESSIGEYLYTHVLDDPLPLLPGVLYEDLAHKYGPVLTMYDEEFCVVPLSRDCRTNPFRVQIENITKSPFLLHAILAVSSQHLAKKNNDSALTIEMYNHRSTALQLFGEALSRSNIIPLLDTIVVLVNLETTQTASSTWGVHLKGAQSLLERHGVVDMYRGDSRMHAQIAMIVWWDVTIAFISRKEPRLPMAYLEMLEGQENGDNWSFFVLNGCPVEFVLAMTRLAKLAAIYTKTTRMEWTIFDRTPVDAVIEQVKNYVNEEEASFDDVEMRQENPDTRRNRFHCIEAWRHAILLYAYRVFVPKQEAPRLRLIDHLARLILDSVRCIPKMEVLQKQLLLPMFLAGAEVSDEYTRRFVRDYCKHWSDTSRFYHFESAGTLLETIWRDERFSKRDEYWWGAKVDAEAWTQSDDSAQPMVSELLFG